MSRELRERARRKIIRAIGRKDYKDACNIAMFYGPSMVQFAIEKAYQMGMLHGEDEAMDRYSHVYGELEDEDED